VRCQAGDSIVDPAIIALALSSCHERRICIQRRACLDRVREHVACLNIETDVGSIPTMISTGGTSNFRKPRIPNEASR
jgi:hypothetical protein